MKEFKAPDFEAMAKASMKKFEYEIRREKQSSFDHSHNSRNTVDSFLNIMGNNGWEIVQMTNNKEYFVFIFKREKQNQ
jgi:hypothetical protein